ncbi:hypothetical protein OSTOST_04252 [Ostertagia ostertagi]
MHSLLSFLLVAICVVTVAGQFYGGRGPYGGGFGRSPYGGGFNRGYGGGFNRGPYGGSPYGMQGGFGRMNPVQGAMMGAMMGAMRG